jgi:hypothetical protein
MIPLNCNSEGIFCPDISGLIGIARELQEKGRYNGTHGKAVVRQAHRGSSGQT